MREIECDIKDVEMILLELEEDTAVKITGDANNGELEAIRFVPWRILQCKTKPKGERKTRPPKLSLDLSALSGVTKISNGTNTAFDKRRDIFHFLNLVSLVLPPNLQEIGARTFRDCKGLSEINIPDGVQEIGECAFFGCESLMRVDIPQSVHHIGKMAFAFCAFSNEFTVQVADLRFENSLCICENKVLYCTDIRAKTISIPEDVAEIADRAFVLCREIESVDFPKSIREIGSHAFSNCRKLPLPEFSDDVKIGNGAFEYCGVPFRDKNAQ